MTAQEENKSKQKEKVCGIIMPISQHPDYPRDHWKDVFDILSEAVSETDFTPKLVSDDPAIGLIHERIVQNIYNNHIIICDVSSKNPNVMFELGLRLAFDKPTLIVKDEKTGYSFDTAVVEHIEYPSSLRFNQIVDFKQKIKERIITTYKKSEEDPNFSPFLKSFGKTIVPTSIHNQEIPESKFIISQLTQISDEIKSIRIENRMNSGYINKAEMLMNKYPSSSLINSLIESYYKNSKKTTNEDLIDYVQTNLSSNGYQLSSDDVKKIFNESENWKKRILK